MNKILYFCDRKKCERCSVYCLYTTDPEHALSKDEWPFVRDASGDWEQVTENTYSYDAVKSWIDVSDKRNENGRGERRC